MENKKIKIYSLSTTYPESPSSKKPKFVHNLNRELVKLGFDVKVLVPHTKGALTYEKMDRVIIKRFRYLPENLEINERSIPVEVNESRFGKFKVVLMISAFFIFTFFECLKERPKIIHGNWAFPGGYIAFIISKIFGAKCVISIHGGETPLIKKFKFLFKRTINCLNNCDKVIVNSNFIKNEFEALGVCKNNLITINPTPNFVKHKSDKEKLKIFRQKFVDDDFKIILFVGRLIERKGPEYVVRAVPKIKHPKIHLIVAGGGLLLDELKKLSTELNVQNKVTFFGPPTDEELGYLHDISDAFVMPSIEDSKGETEALGLVIPEAMESNLPVIASAVGGIVDMVKNGENGILVEQKDSIAIAEAVDKLFSDKKFSEELVRNSKKLVNEFLPTTIAKKHMEVFQNL